MAARKISRETKKKVRKEIVQHLVYLFMPGKKKNCKFEFCNNYNTKKNFEIEIKEICLKNNKY